MHNKVSYSFIHGKLLIEHLTSRRYRAIKVEVFICNLTSPSSRTVECCCFCVSDPSAEEEGPSQAGSSLPAVELPRKRKGDVEARSDSHVQ